MAQEAPVSFAAVEHRLAEPPAKAAGGPAVPRFAGSLGAASMAESESEEDAHASWCPRSTKLYGSMGVNGLGVRVDSG